MPASCSAMSALRVAAESHFEHFARRVAADEFGRCALGHDLALVDDHEPIAELLGLVHVVGRQQQRGALLLEAEQPVPEDVSRLGVEAGRRLVEQQHARVVDERPRDGEPPLHAARERVDLRLALVFELGEGEQFVGAFCDELARQTEVPPVHQQVLADPQLGVEVVGLRHDAELRPDLWAEPVGVEPEDRQVSGGARRDRADHAHGRRLARAVRAEQPERLARCDLERDAVDGGELAVSLHEVSGDDDWLRHKHPR